MDAKPIGIYIAALRERGIKAATLLGKGPSLDDYVPVDGAYVMGVNDVPSCQRCDAVVYGDKPYDSYPYDESVDILRPIRRKQAHEGRGYYWDLWRPGTPYIPHGIPRTMGAGSGTKALGILAFAGVEVVTLWGFDGGVAVLGSREYAKCVSDDRPPSTPGKNATAHGANMLDICCQSWSAIRVLEHGTHAGMWRLWESIGERGADQQVHCNAT